MPRITRKTRDKRKEIREQDDTESESGKLSETQEVAKRLSRTRLGKENVSRHHHKPSKQGPLDPYDADSEVESDVNLPPDSTLDTRTPMSPMATDNLMDNLHLSVNPRLSALRHQSLFNHDHSTPSTTTPGKSDDSLFGFSTALGSPLPFSPVRGTPISSAYTASSPSGSVYSVASSMSTSISPGKRKLQLRVFDMQIERPSKKAKKKKQKQARPGISSNDLHDVHAEFEEVEMFDLVIE